MKPKKNLPQQTSHGALRARRICRRCAPSSARSTLRAMRRSPSPCWKRRSTPPRCSSCWKPWVFWMIQISQWDHEWSWIWGSSVARGYDILTARMKAMAICWWKLKVLNMCVKMMRFWLQSFSHVVCIYIYTHMYTYRERERDMLCNDPCLRVHWRWIMIISGRTGFKQWD